MSTITTERGRSATLVRSTLRTIMVTLDGSPFAEQALPLAEALARRTGATLHLVRANEPLLAGAFPVSTAWQEEVTRNAQAYLETLAGEVGMTGTPVHTTVVEGAPVTAICWEASRVGADLIVMSTHGRTGVARAWLGSVADGVARHTDAPVLLLRPAELLNGAGCEPAVRRILVALDGSRDAESVLDGVRVLAAAFQSAIVLLRVIPPVALPVVELSPAQPTMVADPELTSRQVEEASVYLDDVAMRLREGGLRHVERRVITSPNVADALVAEARDCCADVVALASHGRGASRLVFGSVLDRVMRRSSSAVLLTHATS